SRARFVSPWKRSKRATKKFPGTATWFSTARDPTKRPAPGWRCSSEPKALPGSARSKAASTPGSRTISLSSPKPRSINPLFFERRYFSRVRDVDKDPDCQGARPDPEFPLLTPDPLLLPNFFPTITNRRIAALLLLLHSSFLYLGLL